MERTLTSIIRFARPCPNPNLEVITTQILNKVKHSDRINSACWSLNYNLGTVYIQVKNRLFSATRTVYFQPRGPYIFSQDCIFSTWPYFMYVIESVCWWNGMLAKFSAWNINLSSKFIKGFRKVNERDWKFTNRFLWLWGLLSRRVGKVQMSHFQIRI